VRIKYLPFFRNYRKPYLPERAHYQGLAFFSFEAHKRNIIASSNQGVAYPDHTLIIIKIVGHGTNDTKWLFHVPDAQDSISAIIQSFQRGYRSILCYENCWLMLFVILNFIS
jgi:hypothetical protein